MLAVLCLKKLHLQSFASEIKTKSGRKRKRKKEEQKRENQLRFIEIEDWSEDLVKLNSQPPIIR